MNAQAVLLRVASKKGHNLIEAQGVVLWELAKGLYLDDST